MDTDTQAKLGHSLHTFGLRLPLLVRTIGDGFECIAGNMRLEVLRAEGVAEVPCILADDLTEPQCKLLSLALNRLGGWGQRERESEAPAEPERRRAHSRGPRGGAAGRRHRPTRARRPGPREPGGRRRAAPSLEQDGTGQGGGKAPRLDPAVHRRPTEHRHGGRGEGAHPPHVANYEGPNVKGAALAAIAEEWLHGRGYRAAATRKRGHLRVVSGKATPQTPKEA